MKLNKNGGMCWVSIAPIFNKDRICVGNCAKIIQDGKVIESKAFVVKAKAPKRIETVEQYDTYLSGNFRADVDKTETEAKRWGGVRARLYNREIKG